MATAFQQLGQLRPANTTAASLYSPGASEDATINDLVACNVSSDSAKFRIFIDDNGTTYDETTAICWDIVVLPGEFFKYPGTITMNDSSGNLAVRTDTASAFNFTASGTVTT